MITFLLELLRLLPFLVGGHRQLALENLALRQQLAVYKRTAPRPKLRTMDRLFFSEAAIAENVGWRGVVWEGVHDLLGRPVRGGVFGSVEVDDTPAMVGEHDEDEEHPQACDGDREEIEGDQVRDVVGEERAPGLRRRGAPLREQARDGALGHVDAQLEQLAMDSGAPHRGLAAAIWVTSARISGVTGGRPTTGRWERRVQ
jgi:hypothetical protein